MNRATYIYFCFEPRDSMILLVWSHQEVLKEFHKTGSMRVSFYICIPGMCYEFENAVFKKHFV